MNVKEFNEQCKPGDEVLVKKDDDMDFLLDEEKLNQIKESRPVRRKDSAKIIITAIAMWIVSLAVSVAVVAALITLMPIP